VFMMSRSLFRCGWLAALLTIMTAAGAQTSPQTPDIPAKFEAPTAASNECQRRFPGTSPATGGCYS